MIARLTGKIVDIRSNFLILDVHGVGYRVENYAPYRLGLEGHDVTIEIYTLLRQDELRLFGFASRSELELFEKLLSVSGVGPKSAMLLTSNFSVGQIQTAVETADYKSLQVKGVGQKTLAKIVIELQGKLNFSLQPQIGRVEGELSAALNSLGYSQSEVRTVVEKIDPKKSFADQVKQALSLLSA